MSELTTFYRQQPTVAQEAAELDATARARGLTARELAAERDQAAAEYRQAETARVAEIVNNPALLAQLRRYWNRGITGETLLTDPLAPVPPAPTAPRTGQASSGRSVPNQQFPSRSGSARSDAERDLAAALMRASRRV
jgi:hypothetical protein